MGDWVYTDLQSSVDIYGRVLDFFDADFDSASSHNPIVRPASGCNNPGSKFILMKLSVSSYGSIPSSALLPRIPQYEMLTKPILSYSSTKLAREVSRCLYRRHRRLASKLRRRTFHPKYPSCPSMRVPDQTFPLWVSALEFKFNSKYVAALVDLHQGLLVHCRLVGRTMQEKQCVASETPKESNSMPGLPASQLIGLSEQMLAAKPLSVMSVLSCPLSSPDWCTFCIRSALLAGQISWQNSSDREIPPDHAMKARQDKAHRYSDAVRGNSHSCLSSISWRSISDPVRKYPARATAPSVVDEGGKPISRCHPAVTGLSVLNGDTYGAQLALALAPLRAVPDVNAQLVEWSNHGPGLACPDYLIASKFIVPGLDLPFLQFTYGVQSIVLLISHDTEDDRFDLTQLPLPTADVHSPQLLLLQYDTSPIHNAGLTLTRVYCCFGVAARGRQPDRQTNRVTIIYLSTGCSQQHSMHVAEQTMVRPSCTLRVHNEPDNSKWGENCDAEADARGCLGQIAMPRCGVILLAFA
ncbi:uncharacterized protein BO96DRAFT_429179 [Aspergillus niger CBS 101883]|uniref:Uncharacterized protein n=3 Tax=Aspergillus niger TaxID=5061 RepID=A2QMQ5_ASPNC|nr:uncharacterized protein BO96DRAFT_429179 [Aspergillus niger CBS 101883]XP_059606648.1 hypothetical protein An07g02950 [Aspergillus niger]PYH62606.1 hypothetical protein BO96DRAFT_429179 [Aspergillus niger CBS 101883]RDH16610.1 hypothetical protein M747DRAFT_325398 [Aspergillus niger ATCC 13496]CAL00229.1 hypothetical protein An07g02950 [Aspergillus niger]